MWKRKYVFMAKDEEGSQGSSGEAVGTNNDARIALLNKINDQNDEATSDQFVDIVDLDKGITEPFTVKKPDGTTEELQDEAVHEQIVDQDAEKKPVVQETVPVKHKIKIDGVEQELPIEEIIARAQKVTKADQYLAEAARIRNELEQQKLSVIKTDVSAAPVVSDEDDLALARAIQMGSEEEAKAAVRKIREQVLESVKASNKGPSNDDLSRTIDERLTFNEAISKFNSDYKDLVADPKLHKMVLDRDAELIVQGDRRPYYERYKEVGDEVRAWYNKGKPASEEPKQKEVVVDKEARKAGAPAVPKAAGGKVPSTVEEETVESDQEIIAKMAAARGGPQWMRGEKIA
jgi:hypothetical protein